MQDIMYLLGYVLFGIATVIVLSIVFGGMHFIGQFILGVIVSLL